MNVSRLLLLISASAAIQAAPLQKVELDGLDVVVVGHANRSTIAIGVPEQANTEVKDVHCQKIRQTIVGEQIMVKVSLPEDFIDQCRKNR